MKLEGKRNAPMDEPEDDHADSAIEVVLSVRLVNYLIENDLIQYALLWSQEKGAYESDHPFKAGFDLKIK